MQFLAHGTRPQEALGSTWVTGLEDTHGKTWKGSSSTDSVSMQDTSAVGHSFWHLHLKGIHQQSRGPGTDLLQKIWGLIVCRIFFSRLISKVLFYSLLAAVERAWSYILGYKHFSNCFWVGSAETVTKDRMWVITKSRDTDLAVKAGFVEGHYRAISVTALLCLIPCSGSMNTKQHWPQPSRWLLGALIQAVIGKFRPRSSAIPG